MNVEWFVEGESCWTIDGAPYCEFTMDQTQPGPNDIVWTTDSKSSYQKGVMTIRMTWKVKPKIEAWLVANNFRYMIDAEGKAGVNLVFYDKAAPLLLKLTWGGAQC